MRYLILTFLLVGIALVAQFIPAPPSNPIAWQPIPCDTANPNTRMDIVEVGPQTTYPGKWMNVYGCFPKPIPTFSITDSRPGVPCYGVPQSDGTCMYVTPVFGQTSTRFQFIFPNIPPTTTTTTPTLQASR